MSTNKRNRLGNAPVNKLLFDFAVPSIIAMIVGALYNIVDQFFIGRSIGTLGNAATNVLFPLIIIFNAVAGLIWNGAAANAIRGLPIPDESIPIPLESMKFLALDFIFLKYPKRSGIPDESIELSRLDSL